MRSPAVRLLVALCLLAFGGRATGEPRLVHVELRTTAGQSLGRLAGTTEDRTTYFALDDVARLVRGTVRRSGSRVTLTARGQRVEMRRDSGSLAVASRTVALSAPVRLRQGTWQVPGEFLVRALPALVGTGVQVAAVPPPAPPRPSVRTVVATRTPPAPPPRPTVSRPAAARTPVKAPPAPAEPPEASPASSPRPDGETDGPPRPAVKAGAVELRYRSYPGYTRVVLEAPSALEPRLVDSSGALVVALSGLAPAPPRSLRAVRDGLIASLELTESRGMPALRVAFERPPASRKVYRLQDPPRIVLDFYRAPAPAPPTAARVALQTIVVDPGHGGQDPGAIGPGGLREKELTLDVARRLATLLQEELGVRVVLTRSRDQFVPLQERTALANREKADLFVSIHVNAAAGAAATGSETYFLSSEATDNAARAAAAFENKVIALEPGPRTGSRDLLRSILWDLAQSEFQQESSRLAEALQDTLERALRLPSRGVKQAPFYVLGGAAMPAVLVEIGFISNPHEEQRLQDDGYRDRIARALTAGLAGYKRRYDRKAGAVAAQ